MRAFARTTLKGLQMSNAVVSALNKGLEEKASKITPKQKALIDYILIHGATVTEAAKAVGYASHSPAFKALQSQAVQAYMLQATAETLGKGALWAASKLVKLSMSAKSEYVQLEASKDLLDRAGFKPPDRSHVHVDHEMSVTIDLGD